MSRGENSCDFNNTVTEPGIRQPRNRDRVMGENAAREGARGRGIMAGMQGREENLSYFFAPHVIAQLIRLGGCSH
jgi:hypothetical protein